jgi:hypothetical protein
LEDNFMAETNVKSAGGFSWLNWLGWLFALNVAWLLLAAFTVWLGSRSYTLSTEGEVAQGIVVDLFEEDRSDSTSDIYPVVEFEVDGETYSVRSQNNYGWWNRYTRFPIGREVEMRYDPSDPQAAEINSWLDIWGETIILGLFTAVAAIGVNVYLFVWLRRSRR